jgi:putative restriction endonuclease
MRAGQRLWTREELILVINLYCKLPFGKLHQGNPDIIELARLINRSPGSVAFKMNNFASFDPGLQARGIKGAVNASKLDAEVWNEFFNNLETLAFESEKLRAQYLGVSIEAWADEATDLSKEGKTREQQIQARVNQGFFRKTVMAAYNSTCCITGLMQPELLVASHIRPWALDKENRLNPRNGLAMNALHDRAFEAGLMTIGTDFQIRISSTLKQKVEPSALDYFLRYEGEQIKMPSRFTPDPSLLEYHNRERFIP